MRARWKKEEGTRGVYQIVVDQIPYQVQKAKLIERIAALMDEKKLPLLEDVRDESAEDLRIVLMPKSRAVEAEILMEQLFRTTELESRFPLNLNVLDQGITPKVMSLREVLNAFIEHRREVLKRRTKHRLAKIADRLEVLDGYLAVYLNLDKVIKIIRHEDEPKPKLMKAFDLTERQATAILDMRLRNLRKLEEKQIREEHASLTQEQKELKKLSGSGDLQSTKLIEEINAINARFGQKTQLGKRRTMFSTAPEIGEDISPEAFIEKEPITIICSEKGWLRTLKGHQEENDSIKYREGDQARFWVHAETTDKLILFSTDGRFFTLECARLPGGRGQGDPIREHIELEPDQDLVAIFIHNPKRRRLLASTSGRGFIIGEGDILATKRTGKQVMNPGDGKAAVCVPAEGDVAAVIGENHKLIIFSVSEVPELAKGRGVILQRYRDGGLRDACIFAWKDGLRDANGRSWMPDELKDWRGTRAQAGKLAPRGFAKSGKFA